MRSKRLSRQLKRHFEVDDITFQTLGIADSQDTNFEVAELHRKLLCNLPEFLDQVDSNYEQSEKMLDVANRNLEISTKETSEANAQLFNLNYTINAMINSLNEGFIVFDSKGLCSTISSKKAVELLGMNPFGKTISEVFRIKESDRKSFEDWYRYLYNPRFDFDDMAQIGPNQLQHEELHISIKYKPMMEEKSGQLAGVIVILSDITSEIQAAKRAERFMYQAEMVTKFYSDQSLFMSVLEMFSKGIHDFKTCTPNITISSRSEILRKLHTLKGCAGAMFMKDLADVCHYHESILRKIWQDDQDLEILKEELRMIADSLEIALIEFHKHNRELLGTQKGTRAPETKMIPVSSIERFGSTLIQYGNGELIDLFVSEFFTIPFEQMLSQFETTGYSSAKKLNKSVEITISCDPTLRVFPDPYRDFFSAFVHIINNSIDHGIEPPEMREACGKRRVGSISISANYRPTRKNNRDFIQLTVSDDGGGIDPFQVRAKLTNLGIENSNKSDAEVIYHIFDIGFSTKDAISEISGRGVGLSAVQEEVKLMNGNISVTSTLGQGTTFIIDLPLIQAKASEVVDLLMSSGDQSTLLSNKKIAS